MLDRVDELEPLTQPYRSPGATHVQESPAPHPYCGDRTLLIFSAAAPLTQTFHQIAQCTRTKCVRSPAQPWHINPGYIVASRKAGY